jgi:hypothetical protein
MLTYCGRRAASERAVRQHAPKFRGGADGQPRDRESLSVSTAASKVRDLVSIAAERKQQVKQNAQQQVSKYMSK